MTGCNVTKRLQVVRGSLDDYKQLCHFHYRDSRLGPFQAIYTLKVKAATAGVIVYTMPSCGLELRNVATGNIFTGFDRATRMSLINKNIRCIGRVIIEPRFRGLGLASRLVRETMAKMAVPIVEAAAVMGLVNPFFEKAGMKAYKAATPTRCIRLIEALSLVGIEQDLLIDSQKVQRSLDSLEQSEADFIEREIKRFLQSYGKRAKISPGPERIGFVLSKLTHRPVYYIWFNPNMKLKI